MQVDVPYGKYSGINVAVEGALRAGDGLTVFCENMNHCLSTKNQRGYERVQGSPFFRGEVYALTAVMLELLVRRIGILCPIVILVVPAGAVGTAVAGIRRLFQRRAHKRSKRGTVFCTVADF